MSRVVVVGDVAGLYRAKFSVRTLELLFCGAGQAARRYSLMTPPRIW